MASFAVTLSSRPRSPECIRVIVDERRTADEIALELRHKGHKVEVEELRSEPTRRQITPTNPLPGKTGSSGVFPEKSP
jgi:hypothetical protein